jgi:hypothetical protein
MANSYSTQDLVKGVLILCGERTDGTSPYHALALKFINDVYKELLAGPTIFAPEIGDAWSWARVTSAIKLPAYQSGSCTLTSGSASGTFSVAPSISLAGYDFHTTGFPTWYTISAHTAGQTSFTLDAAYIDTTGSVSYVAAPLVQDLGGGILRLVEPFRIYTDRVLDYNESSSDMSRIYGMSLLEFWRRFPLREIQNDVPSKFTTTSRSEDSWKVRFNKYVSNPIRIDWDYIQIPSELTDSSTSIPLVPFENRSLLEVGAAYYLNVVKNQTQRAETFFKLATVKIQAMHMAEEKAMKLLSTRYAQLTPRLDDTAIPVWLIQR